MPISDAVILLPLTSLRNLVLPQGDGVVGIRVRAFSPTATAQMFRADDSTGTQVWRIKPSGNGSIELITVQNPNDAGALIQGAVNQAVPVLSLIQAIDGSGNPLSEMDFQNDVEWSIAATDNPTILNPTASITPSQPNTVAATYTGRVDVRVNDHNAPGGGNGRLLMRGEADGSAARVGFLGANAVARQTGASAAGIAAITDPNAKAAISALQTAIANLGFVTSPA